MLADEDNIVFRESRVLMNFRTRKQTNWFTKGCDIKSLMLFLDFHSMATENEKTNQNIVDPLKLYKNTNFILKTAE